MSPRSPQSPPSPPPPAPPVPPVSPVPPDPHLPRLNRRLPYTPDRWQLECERFGVALSRPRPPLVPRDEPHPLADAIPRAIQSLRISDALRASRIADQWTTIVGQNLARLSSPGKIEGDTLFVRVTHPALLPEFRGPVGDQILARLQTLFPTPPILHLHPRVE